MNYIHQQLAYASVVQPQGDIIPVWRSVLQAKVDQEALAEWGRNPIDPALPVFLSEPPRREPLIKFVKGLIP